MSEYSTEFSLVLGSSHTSLVAACTEQPFGLHYTPKIQVLGATRLVHHGAINKGIVTCLDTLSASILDAIDEVERQTGLHMERLITCIPSVQAECTNHTEKIQIKNSEIRAQELNKMHTQIKSSSLIHSLHGYYEVDGRADIKNPVGMKGNEVSLSFHRVSLPQSDLYNVAKALIKCGVNVQKFVYEPIAAAEGVLTDDEKEFGCVSLSIGTHLTHVVVYLNHMPVYTKVFALGSRHITRDLSIGLRTTQNEAERIKKEWGRAYQIPSKDIQERVELYDIEESKIFTITRQDINRIIEPRVKEILTTVCSDLKNEKLLHKVTKGFVLSGGGALLNGISIVTERIAGVPSCIGTPLYVTGFTEGIRSPLWASSLGCFSPMFGSLDKEDSDYIFYEGGTFSKFATKLWQRLKDPFA